MTIRVEIGGDEQRGTAIDLREETVAAEAVATAISGEHEESGTPKLVVDCPAPGSVHDRVGVVTPDRQYELRSALAAVARQRGYETPIDDELRAVEQQLAEIDRTEIELRSVKRELATADEKPQAEQIAALRGRLQARSEAGEATTDVEQQLAAAIQEYSEVGTDRVAAEQAFSTAQERLRDERDRREQRLRLQDQRNNLRRTARKQLAERLWPAFERARAAVPATQHTSSDLDARSNSPAAALAVCRLARLNAPIVVGVDCFPTAQAAAGVLRAPVIIVE